MGVNDIKKNVVWGGGEIRTHDAFKGHNAFQERRLKPLGHPTFSLYVIIKSMKGQSGQSLVEVIIGAAIAGIFILGAGNLLSISNIGSSQNKEYQTATFLAQELAENISTYANTKWYCAPSGSCAGTRGFYNLNKGSSNKYYLINAPLEWRSGEETVSISSQDYNRYFFLENICRLSDGTIFSVQSGSCSGGSTEDTSTQKATIIIKWTMTGKNYNFTLSQYITRTRNAAIIQTDWSGGAGQSGPYADLTKYDSATGMADGGSSGIKGVIKISGF